MGSYLQINKKETNNKVLSSILIYAIRGTDHIIKTEKGFSKKEKKYLKPEYYKDGEGCGDWVIKRKGIALVVKFLLEVLDHNNGKPVVLTIDTVFSVK